MLYFYILGCKITLFCLDLQVISKENIKRTTLRHLQVAQQEVPAAYNPCKVPHVERICDSLRKDN